jgi:hypothetical protein
VFFDEFLNVMKIHTFLNILFVDLGITLQERAFQKAGRVNP